jgi:hypothetical protein
LAVAYKYLLVRACKGGEATPEATVIGPAIKIIADQTMLFDDIMMRGVPFSQFLYAQAQHPARPARERPSFSKYAFYT